MFSKFGSSGSPHLLNQDPPGAQQLNVVCLLLPSTGVMMPHLGHVFVFGLVGARSIHYGMSAMVKDTMTRHHPQSTSWSVHASVSCSVLRHALTYAAVDPLAPRVRVSRVAVIAADAVPSSLRCTTTARVLVPAALRARGRWHRRRKRYGGLCCRF